MKLVHRVTLKINSPLSLNEIKLVEPVAMILHLQFEQF